MIMGHSPLGPDMHPEDERRNGSHSKPGRAVSVACVEAKAVEAPCVEWAGAWRSAWL